MADLDITGRVVVDASQAEGAFDKIGDKAEQMAREVSGAAGKAGQAVDKIGDGAGASAERFTRAESRIQDSIKRTTTSLELLGKTASQKLEFKINEKGLDPAKFEPALVKLREIEAQSMRASVAANGSLNSMGMSAKATAAALRGVPAQFTDIVTSIQGGQAPLTVFLQQGGQLKDMFGGAGNAAKALGGFVMGLITPFTLAAGTVAAVAFAYREGSKEADAYNKAIITTGNASGTTAAQMQQMAQRIGSVVGTQGAAADALAKMAGSSRIAAENFEYFGTVALKVEKTVGTSVAETVKQFAELGKAPVEASKKLNDETNYLTQSIYEQIKALKDQGREADAAATAQKAYADALSSRSDQMTQNLGLIERAWRGITGAAKGAWDAMLNVGRSSSMADEIANVRQQIAQAQGQDKNRQFSLPWDTPLADLQQRLSYLTEEERLMKRGAAAQAERAQAEKAAIEATDALGKANEKAFTKQEQMNKALGEYRANLEKVKAVNPNSALLDPAQVAKSEKAIREQFTERTAAVRKGNDELQKQQDLIAKLSGLDPSFSRDWEILSKAYKSGVLSLDELVKKQAELLAKQPAMTAQIKAQAEAEKERAKAAEELTKTMEAYAKAQQAGVSSAIDAATQAETQLAQYGLLKSEVQELTLAYLEQSRESAALAGEDVSNIDKRIAAQKRLIAATRGLEAREASEDAAKRAAADWQKTADEINSSLTDALLRGFESGKDFAKNLRDTVVNMFKTMVLRPVISAIINPISGAITGMMGLSGAAQAGQSGSAASTAMSAASLFGAGGLGGSLAAGAGWLTGATTLGGSLSAGASLIGAGGAGILPGMGMIAGALGPIAIGIAALSSLIKKSTPHTGGIGAYSAASGATTGSSVGLAFGIDQKHYTQAGEDLSTNVAKSIVGILDATATTFGKQAGYYAATAFADDSSKDGAWGALRIKFGEKVLLDWADTAVRDANVPREFADGEAGQKQYLAEVAKSARDALVQAIGSVDWATGMLTGLGDTVSLESLAQTVQQINAAKAAFVGFGQYMPAFASLADSAVSKIVQASGGVDALAGNMSVFVAEFFTEEERLKVATDNVTAELAKLGFEMPRTRDEFKALLQAQLALGDAGADTAAKLLQLTGAVASVTQQSATATAQMQAEASDRRAFVKARREMQESEQKVQLDAMEASKTAAAELFKSIQDHIKGIDDWLKGALLDTNSLLSPEGKVQEAQAQFDALYAEAARGDATAMGQLTSAASALRDMARDAYASSGAYGSIETDLRARLAALDAGAFDPNRPRDPQPSGAGPAGGALTLAETMSLTGLGSESASLLTSLNRYDKSFLDGLKGLSQADATQALLGANRAIAFGSGGANFYKETASGTAQEYLRVELANGDFASAGGGADAGNVYRMGLQLGLTDDEVRQGLGLMGKGAQADTEFWQSNWSEQSSAIGNWVKTSGQDQDTLTFLYEQNQQIFNSYKEAVEAIRGSGTAQAQGQAQQIELLQSMDKRLADQASNTRMGAIA